MGGLEESCFISTTCCGRIFWGGDRRRGKIWPDRELQGGDTIVFTFHNHSGVDRGHHNRDLTDGTGQGLGSLDQSVGEGDSV